MVKLGRVDVDKIHNILIEVLSGMLRNKNQMIIIKYNRGQFMTYPEQNQRFSENETELVSKPQSTAFSMRAWNYYRIFMEPGQLMLVLKSERC
jgi:hypothetical protein